MPFTWNVSLADFNPDPLLGTQWWDDPARPWEWELWACVLIGALTDASPLRSNTPTIRREAMEWFESSLIACGSFLWVCRELGLSPEPFQAHARELNRRVKDAARESE